MKISKWMKLAHIGLVQVPGSMEEKRLFCKLAHIRDERRNSRHSSRDHIMICGVESTRNGGLSAEKLGRKAGSPSGKYCPSLL